MRKWEALPSESLHASLPVILLWCHDHDKHQIVSAKVTENVVLASQSIHLNGASRRGESALSVIIGWFQKMAIANSLLCSCEMLLVEGILRITRRLALLAVVRIAHRSGFFVRRKCIRIFF